MQVVAGESYYAARSRRDPEWRLEQIAGAVERERRRREAHPEAHRARRREAGRRCRQRQTATGRTFTELLHRVGGDPATLRLILDDEVRRGTIDYCAASRRFRLNGALSADVRFALRDLEL